MTPLVEELLETLSDEAVIDLARAVTEHRPRKRETALAALKDVDDGRIGGALNKAAREAPEEEKVEPATSALPPSNVVAGAADVLDSKLGLAKRVRATKPSQFTYNGKTYAVPKGNRWSTKRWPPEVVAHIIAWCKVNDRRAEAKR